MSDDSSDYHLYLSDLSQRDKPWDTHRGEAETVEKLYKDSEFNRYAERIRACSQRLVFALTAETEQEFKLRLNSAHFCRCRHCPVCQWRRSMRWKARFIQAAPKLVNDFPKARYVFLTLTVKNCPIDELRETLSWMNKSWERLSKRKEFPAIGWVKSVEVTRNPKDGSSHPHFHILMMVRSNYFTTGYVKQERWRELWRESLRVEYLPVVNIKTVRSRPDKAPIVPGTNAVDDAGGLVAGIVETLKYGVKISDLVADPAWLHELTRQMHKTRAVAIGGVLRDYIQDKEPEDLITEDESLDPVPGDALMLYFDWAWQVRKYVKVDPR